MAIISASNFPFEADSESSTPLWVQLRKRIAYLITAGYFKPGDQLPKIRELAVELSMNFNTVNKSYLSLASDGYVESVRGKGVFIRDVEAGGTSEEQAQIHAVFDDFLRSCASLGLPPEEAANQFSLYVRRKALTEGKAVGNKTEGPSVIYSLPPNFNTKEA